DGSSRAARKSPRGGSPKARATRGFIAARSPPRAFMQNVSCRRPRGSRAPSSTATPCSRWRTNSSSTEASSRPLAFAQDKLRPGPYAGGCSNVERHFSRLQPGETAKDYWDGTPAGGSERYVTQILADPADALVVNVSVPDDRELFVNRATQQVAFALLVCYPT